MGEVNLLSTCQSVSQSLSQSVGLGLKVFWRYFHKGWLTQLINQSMRDGGVCRAARVKWCFFNGLILPSGGVAVGMVCYPIMNKPCICIMTYENGFHKHVSTIYIQDASFLLVLMQKKFFPRKQAASLSKRTFICRVFSGLGWCYSNGLFEVNSFRCCTNVRNGFQNISYT